MKLSSSAKEKGKKFFFTSALLLFTIIIHSAIILNTTSDPGQPFQKYLNGAERFISGSIEPERISDFSPLYLQIHIMVKKIFKDVLPVLILLNIIAISISSVFFFYLLRLFFSLSISLSGFLLFVFSPGILIYEKVIEPEPIQVMFITGMIYFLVRFLRGVKKYLLKDIFLSGFFFGLTLLTRSSLFLLFILIPAYLYFYHPKKRRKEIKWGKWVWTFLSFPIIALVLIVVQNYMSTGSFSYYYQNPGYIIFEGNNPNSRGQSAIYPPLVDEMAYEFTDEPDVHHKIYRIFARRINNKDMTIQEVNKFWSAKAFNFIKDNPDHFLKGILIKLQYLFHDYRRHDVKEAFDYDKTLSDAHVPLFPFWILSSLAIIGLITGLMKFRSLFPLYAVFALQGAVLMAGYVSSRQRVSVMIIFIFFACLAIDKLTGKNHLIPLIILIPVVTIPVLFVKNDYMIEEEFLWKSYSESGELWMDARKERDRSNFKRSAELVRESLIPTPWMDEERRPAEAWFGPEGYSGSLLHLLKTRELFTHSERYNRAILLYKSGELERSEIIFKNLAREGKGFKRDFDHSSRPEHWLGLICIKKGDNKKAESYFRKALELSPGSPFSLSYLFALTGDERYEKKMFSYFDKINGNYFIGRAFLKMKMFHNAVKYLSYVHEKIPEYRKGNICYAVALAGAGDPVTAYNIYSEALKKRREPVLFETETIEIFRTRVEKQPGNGVAHYFLGQIYEQYGYFKKALESYIKSGELMGKRDIIMKKLKNIRKKILSVSKTQGNI